MSTPVTMDNIRRFLNTHRIAIAGASRNEQDYSRLVAKEFEQRGYDVLYLNPGVSAIDGKPCYAAVDQIQPPPESVIILVPESHVLETARLCMRAGVQHLWFRHNENTSGDYRTAIEGSRTAGANVVCGECPLMFLPNMPWVHRAHHFLRQVTGTLPA